MFIAQCPEMTTLKSRTTAETIFFVTIIIKMVDGGLSLEIREKDLNRYRECM